MWQRVGALVQWLREEAHNQKFVSLHPVTTYWMVINLLQDCIV